MLATEETSATQLVSRRPIKSRSWSQRGTKVNGSHHGYYPTQTGRDPNRDKIHARSDHPKTPDTYRRQDDAFGYELQFPLYKKYSAASS